MRSDGDGRDQPYDFLGKAAFPKAVKATKSYEYEYRSTPGSASPHARHDLLLRTLHLLFQQMAYCMSPKSQMQTRHIKRGGKPVLAFPIEGQVLKHTWRAAEP